jgi:spore coat protein CotH
VFGTDRLHQITITLDPTGYARIFTDKVECDPARNDQRFAADVTFDGVALTRVGARRKGNWGSINAARPAFSLKFNWDPGRKDQRLFGLDKLTLNNGVQDRGLLSEHMTYEIARNGGIAAPLTSHALVTVNGVVRGIYIIKESIDGDFLGRSFGAGNKSGNLYEGEWLRDECGGVKPEFLRAAEDPKVMRAMDLKDEAEEMRTRADLLGAIDAVRKTSTSANGGDTWIAEVGKHIDLSQFITFFAVEALTNHTDGYIVLANNYFIYRRPDLQRFQFIHHGADRGFDVVERIDPLAPTLSEAPNLARYVFQLPKTRELYKAELTRLIKLWDTALLTARVAAVARAFMPLRGRTEPVVVSDLRRFDRVRPNVEGLIRERKALVVR